MKIVRKFDTIFSRFEFIFHREKSSNFSSRLQIPSLPTVYSGSCISLDDQERGREKRCFSIRFPGNSSERAIAINLCRFRKYIQGTPCYSWFYKHVAFPSRFRQVYICACPFMIYAWSPTMKKNGERGRERERERERKKERKKRRDWMMGDQNFKPTREFHLEYTRDMTDFWSSILFISIRLRVRSKGEIWRRIELKKSIIRDC